MGVFMQEGNIMHSYLNTGHDVVLFLRAVFTKHFNCIPSIINNHTNNHTDAAHAQ